MISNLINSIAQFFFTLIGNIMPALGLSPEFISRMDSSLVIVISLIQTASWFLPLDVLVLCMSSILLVDNWSLLLRVIRWIIDQLPFT